MSLETSKVSKAEAARRLHKVPLPVLEAVVAQLQEELKQERQGLLADQNEWFNVMKCMTEAERELTEAQRCAEAREWREAQMAASFARTAQLLDAAARRRADLEAAIAELEDELAQVMTAPALLTDELSLIAEDRRHLSRDCSDANAM